MGPDSGPVDPDVPAGGVGRGLARESSARASLHPARSAVGTPDGFVVGVGVVAVGVVGVGVVGVGVVGVGVGFAGVVLGVGVALVGAGVSLSVGVAVGVSLAAGVGAGVGDVLRVSLGETSGRVGAGATLVAVGLGCCWARTRRAAP